MEKLIEDMSKINSYKDLQERNLSFSDFSALEVIVRELKEEKKSAFFQTSIARYLMKLGLKIECSTIHFVVRA